MGDLSWGARGLPGKGRVCLRAGQGHWLWRSEVSRGHGTVPGGDTVSGAHGPRDAGDASTNVQTGGHVTWRDRPWVCSEPRLGHLVLSCGSSSFFTVVAHALGVQNSSYHSCSDGREGSFQLPTVKTDQQ